MQKLIIFNSRDTLVRIDIRNIVFFEAEGNYTFMVSANKLRSCLTMNLSHTEQALANQLGAMAHRFVRIGKRYIINMRHIYKIDTLKQTLTLSDGSSFMFQLPVSKDALKQIKNILIDNAKK